eukprot:4151942-Pleurochrysis_carterae.AAC.3
MFHSIRDTFVQATSNRQDVKELIPEFFYQPEILRNLNGLDLGERQDRVALGAVRIARADAVADEIEPARAYDLSLS